ncbi:PTS IIA-like nitrogen-regulatory protein PtsN [Marinobacterium nitratireducens]|uniref:PTS IIA-like nitrogen-regulatory protein PtsN n=1 Tax=Marinobacterium nitratireducens TaxID=518897 RepID=A0A917ZIN8_9GAMM|nr:PTS IIA-like nitrogen regulatory protein PtsN [Marinobacterium nitratireducens]GGO82849.1 PTS IIA-like nitrogen-regulatory protein PtsN [Marinobacterium nitratireducens]
MYLHELLTPPLTLCNLDGGSKKRVLETASKIIAEHTEGLAAEDIFSGLIGRERLGSTGIGSGIAIPHCRLDNASQAIGMLIKLVEPIDFDAIDNQPVDLLCLLLVPSEASDEHLQTLAMLAELFSRQDVLSALRDTSTDQQLYDTALRLAEA